jgi:hypothetical protein
MISNERPSPYRSRASFEAAGNPTASPDVTLRTERLQVERKTFILSLKENPRGRFLRITEDVGGRRDAIIVPAPGLRDLARVLLELAQAAEEPPSNSGNGARG